MAALMLSRRAKLTVPMRLHSVRCIAFHILIADFYWAGFGPVCFQRPHFVNQCVIVAAAAREIAIGNFEKIL
jgi:hypothetical protein